jgi:hypothetical protein
MVCLVPVKWLLSVNGLFHIQELVCVAFVAQLRLVFQVNLSL